MSPPGPSHPVSPRLRILVGLLAVLHAGLMLYDLESDPPREVSSSVGIYTDEGWKTYAARNRALFGTWKTNPAETDAWRHESPIGTAIFLATFKLLGVGLWQGRLVGVLASVGTLLALFGLTRRLIGDRTALAAAIFWTFDFNAIQFGRLALFASPVTFFLTAAAWAWVRSRQDPRWGIGAGAGWWLAYLCKPAALLAAPAFLVEAARGLLPRAPRPARILLAALAGIAILWGLLWVLPHATEAFDKQREQATTRAAPGGIRGILTVLTVFDSPFFGKHPPLWLLAGLGLAWAAGSERRLRWEGSDRLRLPVLWLAGGIAILALHAYRPSRYYLPLLPPACVLAAAFLTRGIPDLVRTLRGERGGGAGLGALPLLAIGMFAFAFALIQLRPPEHPLRAAVLLTMMFTGITLFACHHMPKLKRTGEIAVRTAVLVTVPCLLARQVPTWRDATHRMRDGGRALERIIDTLPPGSYLAGEAAAIFALACRRPLGDADPAPPGTPYRQIEKFRRLRPTHVLLRDADVGESVPESFVEETEEIAAIETPLGRATVRAVPEGTWDRTDGEPATR